MPPITTDTEQKTDKELMKPRLMFRGAKAETIRSIGRAYRKMTQ